MSTPKSSLLQALFSVTAAYLVQAFSSLSWKNLLTILSGCLSLPSLLPPAIRVNFPEQVSNDIIPEKPKLVSAPFSAG